MADSTNAHFGPIPIQLVASQLGIEGLDEETAEELAIQVEYRIKQIVQVMTFFSRTRPLCTFPMLDMTPMCLQLGRKFMKHSKREELCSEDVDGALRLFNVESLLALLPRKNEEKKRLMPPRDMRARRFNSDLPIVPLSCVNVSILEEALPKCPPEPTFSVHWLAVEGQQPNVPQNPSFGD
eukprot:1394967-Amorphochlora_amoeboformis.AAC.2